MTKGIVVLLGAAFAAALATAAAQAPPAAKKVLIAHRGASAYAPEHTIAAYTLALEQGADFVEQDLAVTSDGVLVCIHDLTLERTTNVAEVFPDRYSRAPGDGRAAIPPPSAATAASAPAAPTRRWLV
ncbi:MAG: glycerophosphodiester phosphodiesterase family protein, partial [Acidobacteriota bacterium]